MDKESLERKWLSGKLTDDELAKFKALDDYDLNLKILEAAKHFKASQFSNVAGFDELKPKLTQKEVSVRKLRPYSILYRIAAILVIALGIYFGYFYTSLTHVETLASEKTTFELPDASSVALNAHSAVSYNKKKWADKRELELDGEAYFKVAKGSKFDVITTEGTVSVLGTQFNVKNRQDYFEVVCFEGIVQVTSHGNSHKLTKGNSYRLLNGKEELSTTENLSPTWINNSSSFKSVPLKIVLEELERQYNITITVQNIDTKRLFTGGFVHTDLDEALNTITVPFNLAYKKELNQITLFNRE